MKIKKAASDFKETDLPSNRIEMFKDCTKVRFMELLKSGLVCFIFLIPILLVLLMKTVSISSLDTESLSTEELYSTFYSIIFLYDILFVIASIFAAFGIAGLTRAIRQIAWGEPLFFTKDFFDGIKLNVKFIIVATIILSLSYVSCDIIQYSSSDISNIIKALPTSTFFVLIIPLYLYNLSQINVYDTKFFNCTKNSCILYIKSAPKTLLFVLFIILITCIKYMSNFMIMLLILCILLIFVLPIFYLAWFLFSCSTLDKIININYYPEIVDKGIHRKPGYKKLEPTIPTKSIEELQKEIDDENALLDAEEKNESSNDSIQNEQE